MGAGGVAEGEGRDVLEAANKILVVTNKGLVAANKGLEAEKSELEEGRAALLAQASPYTLNPRSQPPDPQPPALNS